jgi:hypothetical protein
VEQPRRFRCSQSGIAFALAGARIAEMDSHGRGGEVRTVFTKCFSVLLFTAFLLPSDRADAQSITVSGYADAQGSSGPLVFVGSRGFTYQQVLTIKDNIPGASACNGDPAHCVPGTTVNLHANGTVDSAARFPSTAHSLTKHRTVRRRRRCR